MTSSYDDRQDHIPEMQTPEIETFRNVYTGRKYTINFEIPEFTAICPKTGLPDFGTIHISYVPNEKCLELKSLKEYILSFRTIGIFHENVINKITEDIIRNAYPVYLRVYGDFNIRGGIKTTVERIYEKES